MLCDVVVVRRLWAHAPVIHAASHLYHEKRVAWVSISMHTCDPVPIVMGLRLASGRRNSDITRFPVTFSTHEEAAWPSGQRGRVVSVLDSQFGGPGLKSRSNH